MPDTMPHSAPGVAAARPVPPRYRWLRRILLAAAVLIVALTGLRCWWGWQAERRVRALIAGYRAAGQPVSIADFQFPALPDEQNAALPLRQAAGMLATPPGLPFEIGDACDRLSLVARRADQVGRLIDANAQPLRLARQARARPHADWQIPLRSPVINVLLPHLGPQRRLAKVLCAASLYHHYSRDDDEALETLRDVLHQARRVNERPAMLITHLVAIAISSLATNVVEQIAPRLRVAPQAGLTPPGAPATRPARRAALRALIAELLDDRPLRRRWAEALYTERLIALDVLSPAGRAALLRSGPWFGVLILSPEPLIKLDISNILRDCTRVAAAGAAASYAQARKLVPRRVEPDNPIARRARTLSSILLPSFDRALQLHYLAIAQRRMAATALAIRLFELDHGHRPGALEQLVPDYLPLVPADPFAAGARPLGYRPHAPKPLLYSLGPDGADDGGRYGLRQHGNVRWDARDVPFFLNGDRPRAPLPALATRRAATQAVVDQGDKVGRPGQDRQRQPPHEQP